MASTVPRSINDENHVLATNVKTNAINDNNLDPSPNRRVLSDVSPNVKRSGNVHTSHNRPMTGSPLKRSFTAMVEQNHGLTYLKRRRLSEDDNLDQSIDPSASSSRRIFNQPERQNSMPIPSDETIVAPIALSPVNEASPTEVDSTSDRDDERPSSTGRKSFSSLINYDHSSQPAHPIFSQQQPTTTSTSSPTTKAELLKLRLRIAIYKVRTNQIDIPFCDLRVDGPNSLKQSTSAAVEEAVAALRREAQFAIPPATSFPKLLPAPVLYPPRESSRAPIQDSAPPSSPPVAYSRTPRAEGVDSTTTTPHARENFALTSPSEDIQSFARRIDVNDSGNEVTGRVAEGLLEMSKSC